MREKGIYGCKINGPVRREAEEASVYALSRSMSSRLKQLVRKRRRPTCLLPLQKK